MPKLHMFYLGGNAGRSNIEVHDIQFAVCDDYREAVPALKAAWFGDTDKIHIDGWQVVEWADGYDIAVSETPKTKMPPDPESARQTRRNRLSRLFAHLKQRICFHAKRHIKPPSGRKAAGFSLKRNRDENYQDIYLRLLAYARRA